MKKLGKLFIFTVLLFVCIFISANICFDHFTKKDDDKTYIMMNRVVGALKQSADAAASGDEINAYLSSYLEENRAGFTAEYGRNALPDKVSYIPLEKGKSDVSVLNRGNDSDIVWVLNTGSGIAGLVVFSFENTMTNRLRLMMNVIIAVAFIPVMGVLIYISAVVLSPFERLAEYPLRLSKNGTPDKLPESKNRFFGKFIWGINMLSDKLEKNRVRVNELSRDHMTMLTTIAHGIKTPVANIKLYADAISTGLYQSDGKINESDAQVAVKISKNADDITKLVQELIDKASGAVVDFKPETTAFYLEELKDFLEEEYSNRLKVLSIPYSFELGHNAVIKSDKSGLIRILMQLMDNAIKYGNGEGIYVSINKEEDAYYLTVKNKGEVPDEKELPYLFNGFWRGSNADKHEGSGIGLYEARQIALKLYGDIYVKADAEAKEMEFDVYIPDTSKG